MNYLAAVFGSLCGCMTLMGLGLNTGNWLPTCVVQLCQYGRANICKAKPRFITAIEIPKKWFAHFYLFAVLSQLLVCTAVLRMYFFNMDCECLNNILNFVGGEDRSMTVSATTTVVATLLFYFHLSRRLYETLRVSIYSNTKMNIIHYFLGYIHYAGAILCVVAHSPLLAASTTSTDDGVVSFGILEIASILLFLCGNYIQNRAHVGLANLRKGSKVKKEAMGHKIPHGEMFELISSPNYFAEIIIYIAMCGLFRFGNTSWNVCLVWVIINQIVSGLMNHKWYHSKFENYPKDRKAIIPWVL